MNIQVCTLLMLALCTSCHGQGEKNLPIENAAIPAAQPRLIKTQGSTNVGDNVHCGLQDKREICGLQPLGMVFIVTKNFSKKDGLSHNGVWSILEDKAGYLWIGTRDTGLCRFDGKTFTSFSE